MLQVGLGATGDRLRPENQLFRRPAAEPFADLSLEVPPVCSTSSPGEVGDPIAWPRG
jgi:hypothetical protein